jgi:uroporphyrin-3 C-methyltransferase
VFTSAGIALLAVLTWQAYDTRQDLAALQSHLIESDKSAQEAHALARQRQESIEALQARLGALDARVQEAQGQYAALDAVYAEFSRARDERALAEIEQAVDIAVQQLQLAGNVQAALNALKSADARLALLDQARFLPLRKLIASDMEQLKALPVADVASVALQLETMIGRVDSLPLGFERTLPLPQKEAGKPAKKVAASAPVASAPSTSPNALMGLVDDLWQEFRGLIRIERLDRPDPALLAPSQAAYLRENLRLRLLSARVALLQRDGKLFAEDVQQARDWVKRYFDLESRSVANTAEELGLISQARLSMTLPSLEATQLALRGLKVGGKR